MSINTNNMMMMNRAPKPKAATSSTTMKKPLSLLYVFGIVFMALSTIVLLRTLIIEVAQTFGSSTEPALDPADVDFSFNPSTNHISPIPCHSHNDYWRPVPLYSALRAGCVSVEADVWNWAGNLYVAHNKGAVQINHTLSLMYIDPLVEILRERNAGRGPNQTALGVYEEAPDQTLVLLVDIKADAFRSWQRLLGLLAPLRERGWLSHSRNGVFVSRPITVVGTGETALNMVLEQNPWQDVFLDAPLSSLDNKTYTTANSYYASVSFRKTIGSFGAHGLTDTQLTKMRREIRDAHRMGLKVRYWSLPTWPMRRRNMLWDVLLDEGVDILNVDDLPAARAEYERRRRPPLDERRPVMTAPAPAPAPAKEERGWDHEEEEGGDD